MSGRYILVAASLMVGLVGAMPQYMTSDHMAAMDQDPYAGMDGMPATFADAPPPGGSQCKTVCDFHRPVVTPEEIAVAVPQPPKYEQVMVSPPKIHYCPGQVALKEVHQPPVVHKCVQNKVQYVPMRAEFESQPMDPNVLNNVDPCYSAYGAPVKTSAL